MVAKKSNAIQIQKRVEEIKVGLLDGKTYGTILHDGSHKWSVSERQVADYIKTAKEQINKEFKPQRHMELQKHIARRERFLFLTMKYRKKDLYLALKIDDSLAKLKGLMVDNVLVPMESKKLIIEFEKVNEDAIVKYKGNKFQRRVYNAIQKNKRITAIFGGWGVGKTEFTALNHIIIRQLYDNPDVLHLIAANTYSQLYDSTLRPCFKWFDLLGIPHEPKEIPSSHKPFSVFLHNGDKWVEFLIRSMENINTISGLTLGSAWGDEMWGTERWTFDLIDSRLRDTRSKYLQFVITSNTDEPEHWLYTDIVQKYEFNIKPEKGLHPREIIEIVYGTTFDNQKNLPENYIEGLATTLDERMYERFILCKWVSLGSGKMFYNFDRNIHLERTLSLNKNLPLMVSSDFNVDPMCWSIWQQHKDELWCIDQLMVKGNADTETCCKEIHGRYFDDESLDVRQRQLRKLIWFGDASGKYGSTHSQRSDYAIIKNYFESRGIEYEQKVPQANPSIRDSANAVNARLKNAEGRSFVYFDSQKCPDIILSVEGTSYKPGTNEKDDSKDRDPKQRVKTHFGDTVRYIVNYNYPLRKQAVWSQNNAS